MRRPPLVLVVLVLLVGFPAPAQAQAPVTCEDLDPTVGDLFCAAYQRTLHEAQGAVQTAAGSPLKPILPAVLGFTPGLTQRSHSPSGCWGDSTGFIHQSETSRDKVYAVSFTYGTAPASVDS